MEEQKRKDVVTKVAQRFLKNIEGMDGYNKLEYMKKLVDMLDEMHLIALDFAVEMTPNQDKKGN